MPLPLTLEPALVLPGNVHHLCDGMLKGFEVGKRLDVLPKTQQHFELFAFFSQLQQHRRFVIARVRPHDELEGASGTISEISPKRVFVVAREVLHHLFQVHTEIVRRFVDGEMLGLGHPSLRRHNVWLGRQKIAKPWGAPPPRPPGGL